MRAILKTYILLCTILYSFFDLVISALTVPSSAVAAAALQACYAFIGRPGQRDCRGLLLVPTYVWLTWGI